MRNKMENEDLSYINIIYDINKDNKDEYDIFDSEDKDKDEVGDEISIFGSEFVKNNKNKCKMIIDNKKHKITEKYKIKNYNNNKLNIKLKGINNVTDMSYMFNYCRSLSSLPDISNWNTNNVTNMSYIFTWCSSLSSLSDISNWITNNVTDMSGMFNYC